MKVIPTPKMHEKKKKKSKGEKDIQRERQERKTRGHLQNNHVETI